MDAVGGLISMGEDWRPDSYYGSRLHIIKIIYSGGEGSGMATGEGARRVSKRKCESH